MDKNNKKYQEVEARPHFGQLTEKVLKFWKQNKIFEKSVDQRPEDKPYIFYDGPPFVTGLPHYGSLLPSIAKDLIPRYQTMKGHRVERVWGWDCHGMPIEHKVEGELGIKSRRDIENIGLSKFIQTCYSYVSQTSSEWNWYIDRIGRWVDMKQAYKTMDLPFMESVMWVFKTIYDKGLIYQGKRISLYCPRCGTPVSNFEVAMDNSYKDLTENSTIYKFKLENEDKTFILAWSTTPWNKIVTTALAINPEFTYVKVKQNDEYYILAKDTLPILDKGYEVVDEFSGQKLVGQKYEPLYDFKTPEDKEAWIIIGADFVTCEEGTGVVTLAVYGEDDFKVMSEQDIWLLEHLDDEGHITLDHPLFKNIYYLKANKIVDEDLAKRGLIYRIDSHQHSVAVCWRCSTRLYYAPQQAWFVKVQKLKDQLLKTNENINWFPKHLKYGRFKKGIESAPDWCISRNRYWATPMPVWKCDKCSELKVLGSIAEIEKLTGKKITDLHRPYIDEFEFACDDCEGIMKRIPEVLDCWMESGSMPYGQVHYPFENKTKFEKSFPADFIIEYIPQTRAWFYVMHVVANAIFGKNAFKNVVTTGVIKGTDGRKMSKSYGNYPDPKKVIQTYGGDALRLYFMASPVMAGENLNIDEEGIKEEVQRNLGILWNSYKYFVIYANLHNFNPDKIVPTEKLVLGNVMDKWLVLRFKQIHNKISKYLNEYNIPKATGYLRPLIADLSTWYIRRSRDRFVVGDKSALQTLHTILYELCLLMAPFAPFITDEIYQNLFANLDNQPESVHLCLWSKFSLIKNDGEKLLHQMNIVRNICHLGNEERKKNVIPTRQPLSKIHVFSSGPKLDEEYLKIIKSELNIREIIWEQQKDITIDLVKLDIKLTSELKAKGRVRQIIRQIQEARKQAGVNLSEQVIVSLPDWPQEFEDEIKQKTLVRQIKKGDEVKILSTDK